MLGRLRSTVTETLAQYDAVGRNVFSKKRYGTGWGVFRGRYSTESMEQTLEQAVNQRVSQGDPRAAVVGSSQRNLVTLADVPGKSRT